MSKNYKAKNVKQYLFSEELNLYEVQNKKLWFPSNQKILYLDIIRTIMRIDGSKGVE